MSIRSEKNIIYICSDEIIRLSDNHPAISKRGSMVHDLIKSFNLLNYVKTSEPLICTYSDLRTFHAENYLNFLKSFDAVNVDDDDEIDSTEIAENFGLGFDCPIWRRIYKYCLSVAGSTLKASEEILNGANVVINWFGGWHHAQSCKAAGYSYVNDIVLGILKLRQKFSRIIYIDLDIHHGDAVENAFETTKRVFTLSFHQYEPGYYPGTGNVEECGFGAAKGYSANFPYKSGLSGKYFKKYFKRITDKIFEKYQPEVSVIQCGADIIVGDPLGGANIQPEDVGCCIRGWLSKNIPTILLGGGGYNVSNTSRYWTYLTSLVCDKELLLEADIPDSNEHFLSYGPDYCLQITKGQLLDNNDEEYLEGICSQIEGNIEKHNLTAMWDTITM